MIVYRIAKKKWIEDLNGIGAKLAGGRWNPKGIAVLYCASTSSLAILEKLVNTDFDLLPSDLYIAELEVSGASILKLSIDELPKNWNHYPSPDVLKEIGRNWVNESGKLILEIPSAVNPNEVNYLINVEHNEFNHVKIKTSYPFNVDERLRK